MYAAHYHTEHGWRVALVKEARKRVHVVVLDGGVVHRSLPHTELAYLTPTQDIAVTKLKKHFRRIGKQRGITKAAKKLCRQATT